MAEQSATTVMFRALVMLSFVVVILLVALLGPSLPDNVRSFLAGHGQPDPPDSATDEAPPFHGPGETAAAATSGQSASSPFGPSHPQTPPIDSFAAEPGPTTSGAPSQWDQSLESQAWNEPRSQTNAMPVAYDSREAPASFARSSAQSPAWPSRTEVANQSAERATEDVGMTPMTETIDHFTRVQQQLRQLGVTYSSLETMGDQGLYYRFYCRVAVGGDPSSARLFQASDTNAVRTMTTVLHQIQQWQAGSL